MFACAGVSLLAIWLRYLSIPAHVRGNDIIRIILTDFIFNLKHGYYLLTTTVVCLLASCTWCSWKTSACWIFNLTRIHIYLSPVHFIVLETKIQILNNYEKRVVYTLICSILLRMLNLGTMFIKRAERI